MPLIEPNYPSEPFSPWVLLIFIPILVSVAIVLFNLVDKGEPVEPEPVSEVSAIQGDVYVSPRVADVASRHQRRSEALESAERIGDVGDPWKDEESLSARGRVAVAMRSARAAEERAAEAARVARDQAAQTQPTQSTPTPAPSGPAPGGSMGIWDQLAQCESGGNWHINTGNGYYGGLQFLPATWRSVGGTGLPHEHSREEQIHRAQILQQRAGWGQWPACARKLGLR